MVVARLVIRSGASGILLLRVGQYLIGRGSDSHLFINHRTVSRRHAVLSIETTTKAILTDHESLNGTFVNGTQIQEAHLETNLMVSFGDVHCELEWFAPHGSLEDEVATANSGLDHGPQLSEAEQRVLTLLLGGLPEKTIATRLHLSRHTIHTHVKKIYSAFRVHSRAELLANYLRPKQ